MSPTAWTTSPSWLPRRGAPIRSQRSGRRGSASFGSLPVVRPVAMATPMPPMTERQLGCLFTMMESWEPSNLVREVPEEECRSLTAYDPCRSNPGRSLTAHDRWGLIRDLCQNHRGEVREINGSWRYLGAPFPTEDKFFHPQYCLTREEAKMRTT